MAANIEIRKVNGVEVASYVENGRKERAWHKLGQVYDGQISVKEALELSHADYRVEMKNVFAMTPALQALLESDSDVVFKEQLSDYLTDAYVQGRKATMRMDTDKPLGIVSDHYGIVQNQQAFEFIDTLCTGDQKDTPVIECAGVLGQGERVFITAKFPEQIILDNRTDGRVDMYIVFTTSHDGTGSVNCMVTPIRVVCNNTLNMALGKHGNAGKISLRHTSGITNRLDLTRKENAEFAYQTLNLYSVYKNSLEQSFEHLRNIKVSEKQLDDIMAQVMLSEANLKVYRECGINHEDISSVGRNQFIAVKNAMENGIGQELGERGTAMWAINGLTTYFQNDRHYVSDEKKFDSVIQGHAAHKLQQAYDLLIAV